MLARVIYRSSLLRTYKPYQRVYEKLLGILVGNRINQYNTMSSKKQATLARFFGSMKNSKEEKTVTKTDQVQVNDTLKSDETNNKEPIGQDELPIKQEKSIANEERSITNAEESEINKDDEHSLKKMKTENLNGDIKPLITSKIKNNEGTPISEMPRKENKKFFCKVPYSELCDLFEEIEKTSSRLAIIKLCADFFIKIMKDDPQNLVPVTFLFINKLGPDYEPGLELGLGENLLMKTISESCGKSMAQIKNQYREIGDLGRIALEARNVQPTMFKPKPLVVGEVFENLKTIAKSQGKDSQTKKMKLIKRMLTACQGTEAKFLIRSLESKLRIGLAEKTVLIALSKALLVHDEKYRDKEPAMDVVEQAEQKIRDAFCQVPNYEMVINACLDYGIMNLDEHCTIQPGIPLKPMLAKPTKAISEVLDRFQGQTFTSEYKYDGERAQVHLLNDGSMRIYSRNGENMTERYPEIQIKDFLANPDTTTSLILDCEAVAWDKEQNKILPFQVLTTRKRKDVNINEVKVRVCLFAFDILLHNEARLINEPLSKRREMLSQVTKPVEGEFQYATQMTTSNLDELQKFLDDSVKNSCEGLMVKMLDGPESHYEPSKRSRNWLKLKKDYLEGVGDSLDLCVLGAYFGRGKRTGTYGGFLLGCYNTDSEDFETCCKIGTGFSEEMLQTLYEKLSPTVIDGPKSTYIFDSSAEPDVWFEPTMLFEVLTADLSLSPIYKAGSSVYEKGISLRFPRFLRIREDKSVEDATSSEQVIEMYQTQSHVAN